MGTHLADARGMVSRWSLPKGTRDVRIDWLRGFAMVCVIVDHSKRSSLLSWFSYQRFWVVTAAEVFVVLSGIVLGTVYGARLVRYGLASVTKRLLWRALVLYSAFVGVTISILALALLGVDVSTVTTWDPTAIAGFLDPRTMTPHDWMDLLMLRYGPWPFEIVGLYVWLVIVALPCLLMLSVAGWRPLLAVSWAVYLWYRLLPQQLTSAEFESVFPILAWQLLFVHGIVIGYYRERIGTFVARIPKPVPVAIAAACLVFMAFALSNPTIDGPAWLRWRLVSPQAFARVYDTYFSLSDLGIGRILNLAVALPTAYALLAWHRLQFLMGPLKGVLVTLGRGSLGAFVLHVYGLMVLGYLPQSDQLWINTAVQVLLIVSIAGVLKAQQLVQATTPPRVPLHVVEWAPIPSA
jgi:hypothetical protein